MPQQRDSAAALQLKSAAAVFGIAITFLACSQSPQKYLQRGQEFFTQQRFADAELQFRKALSLGEASGESNYRLGLTFAKLQKQPEALEQFEAAVALRPQHEDSAGELAALLLPAYWNDPSHPEPIYKQLHQLADQLLKINPDSYQAHRVKGYLAIGDAQLDAATEHFQKALRVRLQDLDVSAMLVQALFRSGKEESAESVASSYLTARPEAVLMYEVLYREYRQLKREADAEAILRQRIRSNGKDPAARTRLATHFHDVGRTGPMTTTLEEILADRATFPDARLHVGAFYEDIEDYERAQLQYETGIAEKPAGGFAYRKRLLQVHMARGQTAEARSLVDELAREVPDDADVLRLRAALDLDTGETAKMRRALTDLTQLSKRFPADAGVRYHLGRAYWRTGDLKAAQAQLREAIRLRPDYREPRFLLVSVLMERRAFQEALAHADENAAVFPASELASINRVAALRGLGKFAEARVVLNQLRRRHQSSPTLEIEAGFLLLAEGRPNNAEPIFGKLFQPGHPNVRIVAGLAEALTAQGKLDLAIRVLEADLAKAPNRQIVLYAYAETLYRKGAFDGALAQFAALLDREPELAIASVRLSEIHLRQGRPQQALDILQRAISREPSDPALLGQMARAQEMTGLQKDAEETYRRLLKLDPANAAARNNLAHLLSEQGKDLDEALTLARQAVAQDANELAYADTLGRIYSLKGMHKAAADLFDRLVNKQPQDPTIRYHYAIALLGLSNPTHARTQLTAALTQNPGPELRAKILGLLDRT